jgi:hypothetical protein
VKGSRQEILDYKHLVDQAFEEYRTGHDREGFFTLEEVNKLLKKVPSQ